MLSFRLVDGEETTSWRAFLVDLKSRGLLGKALQLITGDGHPALLKAFREIYPLRRIHRGVAHKLRNVVGKLKRLHRERCVAAAKAIFAAPSRTEAIRRFRAWRAKWLLEEERAVRCLEKDLFHCFHYFAEPTAQVRMDLVPIKHLDLQPPSRGRLAKNWVMVVFPAPGSPVNQTLNPFCKASSFLLLL